MSFEDEVVIQGYLHKPGAKLFTKKRFYQLKGSVLSCHRTESKPPEWTLDVQDSIVTGIGGSGIQIEIPDQKTVVVLADTPAQFEEWIHALEFAAARKFEQFYDTELTIGAGMFSEVKISRFKRTKEVGCVKIINKGLTSIKFTERDIKQLINFKHNHLCQIRDVYDLPDKLYVVMEHCKAGDVFHYASDHSSDISEDFIRKVVKQILEGLAYLHDVKNCTHRNLKPSNVLIDKVFPNGSVDVKISDFGYRTLIDKAVRLDDRVLYWGYGVIFLAPEIFRGLDYGPKADMWSLGIIIYMLLVGFSPYMEQHKLKKGLEQTNRLIVDRITKGGKFISFEGEEWDRVSFKAKAFVRRLLSTTEEHRPSSAEALNDKWITAPDGSFPNPIQNSLKEINLSMARSKSMIKSMNKYASLRKIEENPESMQEATINRDKQGFVDRAPTFVMSKQTWNQHNQSRTKMMYGMAGSSMLPAIKSFNNKAPMPKESETEKVGDQPRSLTMPPMPGQKNLKKKESIPIIENKYKTSAISPPLQSPRSQGKIAHTISSKLSGGNSKISTSQTFRTPGGTLGTQGPRPTGLGTQKGNKTFLKKAMEKKGKLENMSRMICRNEIEARGYYNCTRRKGNRTEKKLCVHLVLTNF